MIIIQSVEQAFGGCGENQIFMILRLKVKINIDVMENFQRCHVISAITNNS